MKILVINGPNLNMLGIREPAVYGSRTYEELCAYIEEEAAEIGASVDFIQSNHEGVLIDAIQEAYGEYDGLVINPGAYTHYSYAIYDALKSVGIPAVEVHLSDIRNREAFRATSVTAPACVLQIAGRGFQGYAEGIRYLTERN